MGKLTKRFGSIVGAACVAAMTATTAASAQQQAPPRGPGDVTGLVVMTPSGPATCATWIQWRAPDANPIDKASIVFWVEGYLSGLAAGSHHDVIGLFRTKALADWLDQYCRAHPQTKLQLAVNALGIEMVRHAGGQL